MKKLILFTFLIFSVSLVKSQSSFEGGQMLPSFDYLQKQVGRVNYPYFVYHNICQAGVSLPKNMTAEQGVSLALTLISSPKEFELSKEIQNAIPINTGAILIIYLHNNWKIAYKKLEKSENNIFLNKETLVFSMKPKS